MPYELPAWELTFSITADLTICFHLPVKGLRHRQHSRLWLACISIAWGNDQSSWSTIFTWSPWWWCQTYFTCWIPSCRDTISTLLSALCYFLILYACLSVFHLYNSLSSLLSIAVWFGLLLLWVWPGLMWYHFDLSASVVMNILALNSLANYFPIWSILSDFLSKRSNL